MDTDQQLRPANMRILHVVSSMDPRSGGVVTAVAGLTRALQKSAVEASIFNGFLRSESPDLAHALQQEGIRVCSVDGKARFGKRLRQLIEPLQEAIVACDVIHINALWEEVQHQAAELARQARKPYLFSPHGMLDPWSLSHSKLKKQAYLALRLRNDLQHASVIHYTSKTEQELVARWLLQPPVIVEPNGIELDEFKNLPDPAEFRRKLSQVGDRRIVLFLSRIHPKKGLDLLIPAWAKARRDDAVLVLAGPDNDGYGLTVNAMIAQHGLEKDIIQTGILKGRSRLEAFAAADVFVLPSYQENFGIVVVESLACNCPVIISDQVNIHQEITAAGVGAVVPTKVDPLAEMISRYLSDEPLRIAARDKARRFALETYDWTHIAKRWITHYQRLMNS